MTAVSERPDGRQADRRPQHRADLVEARGQTALEQDQRQRDDPDRPRQLVVVEVDPAGPVGADEHPDAEEQHEAGHAQPPGQQRGDERGGEQGAGGEDQLAVSHARGRRHRRTVCVLPSGQPKSARLDGLSARAPVGDSAGLHAGGRWVEPGLADVAGCSSRRAAGP